MERPGLPPGAWWLPAILWAVGSVVVMMVGFGAATACTTSRSDAECSGIELWAWFGVIAAGLVALLPVSRSLREQATPQWVAAAIGVVFGASVIGMQLV